MISFFGPSFCDTKWEGLKKKFSIHPLWRSVGLTRGSPGAAVVT